MKSHKNQYSMRNRYYNFCVMLKSLQIVPSTEWARSEVGWNEIERILKRLRKKIMQLIIKTTYSY